MKYRNMLPFVALSVLILTSCDDNKMEWYKDPTHGAVTSSELPLQLAEKISRYKPLKEYLSDPNFKLGIGVGMDEYLGDETTTTIVNENFNDLTIGYAMKHGPMVDSKGNLKFDKVDQLFTKTIEAGISIYGHCLIWHTNQNASYLDSLIAPEVIPGPAGSNLLDLSGIEDGTFDGWNRKNGSDAMSIVEGEGLTATSKALKFAVGSSVTAAHSVQLYTPDISAVSGHNYEISFFVRSDNPGKARLTFDGLGNNYPYKDWYATGGSWTEAFETTSQWQQVKITVNDFVSTTFQIAFEFGYLPDVTYYVDNIVVTDKDAEPTVVNLISNGDFESKAITPWGAWSSGKATISEEGEGYGSSYSMKLTSSVDGGAGNAYKAQAGYGFDTPLEVGKTYEFSAMIKASVSTTFQIQIQNSTSYAGECYVDGNVSTTWTEFKKEFTVSKEDMNRFCINFGVSAGDYYIDNIVLSEKVVETRAVTRASGPPILEFCESNKIMTKGHAIIYGMRRWGHPDWMPSDRKEMEFYFEKHIQELALRYKDRIQIWDVVNEPMDDGKTSDIKTGKGKTDLASDEFYWQDYFLTPKDYAVEAFKLARQYGNPDNKLFINDYNLEYNLNKCDGLIKYVEYIESKGATVDGIGTQMHIAIDSNKDNIAQMFQKLGATGKLIKVSELDIKVNTSSPTTENLAQQAEMYQYVIDMYKKYIPADKQYGITIWGVSDNEKEHVNWIPNDAPNLWDANYARKHAYKGVADGLAGKDVSGDFTGDLE